MNKKKNRYREVDVLPPEAMKVSEYAKKCNCNTSYIYQLVRTGKNKFEMIEYRGINFILS